MRQAMVLDIREIEKYYSISEDGMVYSHIRKRWLRPQVNNYGYVHYCLTFGVPRVMWVFAHTLVALKYIGAPPTERHEIDHLDENKQNNHYSNLVWRTHAENILESYRRGRRGHWLGRNKPSPSLETMLLMANAKKKPVVYVKDGVEIPFGSIGEASAGLGTYRKAVYRAIKDGVELKGGILYFIKDIAPTGV
ncbi:MAG: HNH endonuclease [Ignavibacteria bacterium]|nr:HNH endonuclease [Ignavibacteria bacterium]